MKPRKSVHFVARAASNAFFSKDIPVNADGKVNNAQWWGFFTTPIEIEPIPVVALREAVGGYLPLRGRSGLYLRPETIQRLGIRAMNPSDQSELDRVVQVPVGLAELPDAAEWTLAAWREIAAGTLRLEADVSAYLVEPLLREMLRGTGLTWKPEHPIGRRWADFVILDGEKPAHVIEVKKVIKESPQEGWQGSPDFNQLRWYCEQIGLAGTLIDSHRVLLVRHGSGKPYHAVSRSSATAEDLEAIRRHLTQL